MTWLRAKFRLLYIQMERVPLKGYKTNGYRKTTGADCQTNLILGAKAMIPSRYELNEESYGDAYNAIVQGQNAGTNCNR